jgi:hypothetical protein
MRILARLTPTWPTSFPPGPGFQRTHGGRSWQSRRDNPSYGKRERPSGRKIRRILIALPPTIAPHSRPLQFQHIVWFAFAAPKLTALAGPSPGYSPALRETMRPNSLQSESDIERKYLGPHLLILDALEEKAESDFARRSLNRLVCKRMASEKITILASNDNPETLVERVGRSIADRLNDGGGTIFCDWPSLRCRIGGRDE